MNGLGVRLEDLAASLHPELGRVEFCCAPLAGGELLCAGAGEKGHVGVADSLVNVYCAAKFVAVPLLLRSLAAAGVSLDEALGHEWASTHPKLPSLTLREVLGGGVQIGRVNLALARLSELEDIPTLLEEEDFSTVSFAAPTDAQYGEASAQILLTELYKRVVGHSPLPVIAAELEQHQIDVFFGDDALHPVPYERINPYLEPQPGGIVLPLGHDACRSELTRWHYCFGGLASAHGLVDAYRYVFTDAPSAFQQQWFVEPMEPRCGSGTIRWGLACLDIDILGERPVVPEIWGHPGWEGRSLAGVDFVSGHAFAVVTNDMSADQAWTANLASRLIYAIREQLGLD